MKASPPAQLLPHCNISRVILQIRWAFIERVLRRKLVYLEPCTKPVTVGDVLVVAPVLLLLAYGLQSSLADHSPRESGLAAWYSLVATILLATKSFSPFTLLFGMSWERLVPVHYLAALITIFNSILHGYVCYVYGQQQSGDHIHDLGYSPQTPDPTADYSTDELQAPGDRVLSFVESYSNTTNLTASSMPLGEQSDQNLVSYFFFGGTLNVSGTLMGLCLVLLLTQSASRWFRHHYFDAWLVSHVLLVVIVIAASLVHALNESKIFYAWWLLDFVIIRQCVSVLRRDSATLTALGDDVVEVRFEHRPFSFQAGQFVRIAVRELGTAFWQYHPATMSSAPYETDDAATVHFRVRGDWTKRLHALADASDGGAVKTTVAVQGPFGSPVMHLDDHTRYPYVILVCGGIGVTPMMSLARQLMHNHSRSGQRRFKVHLVWAVADGDMANHLPVLMGMDEFIMPSKEDALGDKNIFSDDSEKTDATADTTESGDDPIDRMHAITLPSSIFQGDIYITSGSDPPDWFDPRFRFHFGQRPDLDGILHQTSRSVVKRQRDTLRVAVLACGPRALLHDAQVACQKYNDLKGGVLFEYHEEIFDY